MNSSDLVTVCFDFFADQSDGRVHHVVRRLVPVRVLRQDALMRLEINEAQRVASAWFQKHGGMGPSKRIGVNGWEIARGTDARPRAEDHDELGAERSA